MKIPGIFPLKQKAAQQIEIPEDLDLTFYKQWYSDLAGLSERNLVQHWLRHGKFEGRHPNFTSHLRASGLDEQSLPPDFKVDMYKRLNPDIRNGITNPYIAVEHYLKHGKHENRSYRFDHEFYVDLYSDLHGLTKLDNAINHWIEHGRAEGRHPSLTDLLQANGVDPASLPENLSLETLNELNPGEHFENLNVAIALAVEQKTTRKIKLFADDEENAKFYTKLALHCDAQNLKQKAIELYRLSFLFSNTPLAHEHLGNIMLDMGRPYQAVEHYRFALKYKSDTPWIYHNIAIALSTIHRFHEAIELLRTGIKEFPGSDLLTALLDQTLQKYWDARIQTIESIAESQDRKLLIDEYEATVNFISESYRDLFLKNQASSPRVSLNEEKVLIIGLDFQSAPQCFRYRIAQKMEQLEAAGYTTETIPWAHTSEAMDLINFYDIIIFYRVPGFPSVIKQVQYAKALGKVTFFEVDDLLFEEIGVPALETYGGQVSMETYTSITKDIGSHRAIAKLCDYAISSTIPLADKLKPLVTSQIAYLHRNGLDKHNRLVPRTFKNNETINIFYGSGTLAHNSDFIEEALPAITKILKEYPNTRLTIAGYLTLPDWFLTEFGTKVRRVPFTRDIATYLTYLSYADINLAVLHRDTLSDCKSELKWFEAATFSIPSLVSKTQNYLDVIKHDEDGIIIDNNTEWYPALKRMVENPSLRQRIGLAAFNRVRSEYSVEALAANIDEIIKDALSRNQAR